MAVYLDYMTFFGGMYEERLRSLFHAKCQELDLDLLLVYGRELRSNHPLTRHHNKIFELAHSERIDAIIAISTSLSTHCGAAGLAELAARCAGIPFCSVGIALPGVPSVTVDDRPGLRAAIEHLVRDHGHRRIAFMSGPRENPEAESRLQTYRETLGQHGIALDPELIVCGDFMRSRGYRAMQGMLERGILPEAVVAANDAMALGAIDALQKRGYRVPRDLAVIGFDNIPAASVANPSLTTVAQPFSAIVDAALRGVLEQLAGRAVPTLVPLPTEFITRRSCGCGMPSRKTLPGATPAVAGNASQLLGTRDDALQTALAAALRVAKDDGRATAARLLKALELELEGSANAFLRALEELLQDMGDDKERHSAMQGGITCLREAFQGSTTPLEDLWHEARVLLALGGSTNEFRHRLALESMNMQMLEVGERLLSALDLPTLTSALPGSLSAMGIRTAFISRYPSEGGSELEPLVCLVDGEPRTSDMQPFPDCRLYPDCGIPEQGRHTYLVFPLVSESRSLGILVLQYAAGTEGYPMLRDQIAATLRSIELNRDVVEKTLLHDRSVQERLATAQRMQGLSVLAGSVAHDLNNSLGPLAGLPEVILRELDELPVEPAGLATLRADVETMKNATLRAVQTIKDLLTLSRQGKAAQKLLDLNRLVQSFFDDGSLRLVTKGGPHVVIDVAPDALIVRAADSQLARALMNLVHNAVEAAGCAGHVKVQTRAVRLTEPRSGFELIEPGDYVVVSVSDDGQGIPQADLAHIFEPFFSKKPAGERSGTGLGLAITHAVVKEHGGFVDVLTRVGEGTTFTLYLPRVDGGVRTSVRPVLRRGRARVLIVDDDPVQVRTGRRVLEHLGYVVDSLSSGREAYECFLRAAPSQVSPYEIVLLDMLLNEEHDGIHVLEQIRCLFPTQKAIVVSGHAPPERARLAHEKGLLWLAKPYTMETLGRAIESTLAEGGPRSTLTPPSEAGSAARLRSA